jgi:hypothetical protein
MLSEEILSLLSNNSKKWASQLSSEQVANLLEMLNTIYDDIIYSSIPDQITKIVADPVHEYSAIIGQSGEDKFKTLCKTLPVNYCVKDTTKQGHAGDFTIEFSLNGSIYRCLVDIKNYKNTVPKKEIDKFIEDLSYGSYDAGLLISYTSHFAGYKESVIIESFTTPYGSIPVMIVAEVPDNILTCCIEVIANKMSVVTDKKNSLNLSGSLSYINTVLSQSGATRRLLSDLQKTTSTQIQKCQENLIGLEVHIKQALRQISNSDSCSNKTTPHNLPKKSCLHPSLDEYDSLIVLPSVPNIELRINNIDDTVTKSYPNLIAPFNKHASIDTTHTDDTIEYIDFDFNRYCDNDVSLVQQLVDFEWTEISCSDEVTSDEFKSPFINFRITPLKTKTRVEVFTIDNVGININNDILKLLNKKNLKYIGILTQELINILHSLFI